MGSHFQNLRPLLSIILPVLGALLIATFVGYVMPKIGFTSYDNISKNFTSFSRIDTNILNTIEGVLLNYRADIWSMPFGKSVLKPLFNTGLAILFFTSITAVLYYWRTSRTKTSDYALLLLAAMTLMNLAAYGLSTQGDALIFHRYVYVATVTAIPLAGAFLVYLYEKSSFSRIFYTTVIVLIAGFIANTALTMQVALKNPSEKPNAFTYDLINFAEKQGLSKGYGNYWDSIPATYFTKSNLNVLPIYCNDIKPQKRIFLINTTDYNKTSDSSFLIYQHGNPDFSCLKQDPYGDAVDTHQLPGGYTIYEYDYDILRRME